MFILIFNKTFNSNRFGDVFYEIDLIKEGPSRAPHRIAFKSSWY